MSILSTQQRVDELNLLLVVFEEIEKMELFREWHYAEAKPNSQRLTGQISKATFDCGLLAARKLNEFFSGGRGWPDDIKADRFGPYPNMKAPLAAEQEKRLNKDLAHLTLPGAAGELSPTNIDLFTLPVWRRCENFCEYLLSSYLDPAKSPDSAIASEVHRVLFMVRSHLARVEGKLPPQRLS